MPETEKKIVFLGVGQCARAIAAGLRAGSFAEQLPGLNPSDFKPIKLYGTTRSADRMDEIRYAGIEPVVIESFELHAQTLRDLMNGAYVVVSFPPDAVADNAASSAASGAASIAYISSTAVYGRATGEINETTPVDEESTHARVRLDAEKTWLNAGASILRAPGTYGRGTGMHLRLKSGNYRLPGDGSNWVSRIHVEDLAAMIFSALVGKAKGRIFICGDRQPTTHTEVVEWLVARLGVDLPPSLPLEQCHYTQQGNRRIDASKSMAELGVTLKYPSYVEGYSQELQRT